MKYSFKSSGSPGLSLAPWEVAQMENQALGTRLGIKSDILLPDGIPCKSYRYTSPHKGTQTISKFFLDLSEFEASLSEWNSRQ